MESNTREEYLNFNIKAIETYLGIKFDGMGMVDKEIFFNKHHEERVKVTSKLMADAYYEYIK